MILASFVEPVVVVVVHRSCHTKVADLDRLSRVNETVATRQITTEYSSVVCRFYSDSAVAQHYNVRS